MIRLRIIACEMRIAYGAGMNTYFMKAIAIHFEVKSWGGGSLNLGRSLTEKNATYTTRK